MSVWMWEWGSLTQKAAFGQRTILLLLYVDCSLAYMQENGQQTALPFRVQRRLLSTTRWPAFTLFSVSVWIYNSSQWCSMALHEQLLSFGQPSPCSFCIICWISAITSPGAEDGEDVRVFHLSNGILKAGFIHWKRWRRREKERESLSLSNTHTHVNCSPFLNKITNTLDMVTSPW